jgi:hypothetical protein
MGDVNPRRANAEDMHYRRVGLALARLDYLLATIGSDGHEYKGLSVRMPREPDEDVLITIRALNSEGAPEVAFNGGATLGDAFRTLQTRIDNGSLKWRPDEFGR